MTAAATDHGDRLVLIVGAHRSGTTWLQQLLLAHPQVGGVERTETWLFVTLRTLWNNITDRDRGGISTYVTPTEGADAVRQFADVALGRVGGGGANVERVLERTPAHSMHLPFIATLYPRAWVIHLVRDGRDVAQSLVELDFGADGIKEAAQQWRHVVEVVRADLRLFERAREVRYEQLLADPVAGATDLLEWIGLDVGDATRNELERRAGERVSRFNTTGDVGSGKWRRLDAGAIAVIEAEAGALLRELGYDD